MADQKRQLSESKQLFPVTRNIVYFNHAAVGTLPQPAYEAMERHARDQRDFGALHWRDWYAEDAALRKSAAAILGSEPGEIAILKNTSEGLSFVARGMRWREGDNLVTTAIEFPSNWTPWKRLEERGVEVRAVPATDGTYSPEDIEQQIDDRTRLVTLSSVAFHNGFTPDLEAIGEICSRRNVRFCVDAIQSLGVLPIDVRRARIDFLSADGHKWMCGPEGAGIFFVAAERRDELEVIEHGWMNIQRKGKFIGCDTELLPDARRFEAGALNTNGVYGLRASLDLLLGIGIEAIGVEAIALATALAEGLEAMGWKVESPRPLRSPILAVTPPGVEKSIVWYHRKLEEAGIVCAPREGMLRFSPHFYNSLEEVERIIGALRQISAIR